MCLLGGRLAERGRVFSLESDQTGCWGQFVCGGEGCSVADGKGTWTGSLPKLAEKTGILVEGRGRW